MTLNDKRVMIVQVAVMITTAGLATFVSSDVRCPVSLSSFNENQENQTDVEIKNISSTLHWSLASLSLGNTTDVPGYLVHQLHGSNISNVVFKNNSTDVTAGICFNLLKGGFVVIGTPAFVPTCAELANQKSDAMHTSEWLTVPSDQDMEEMVSVFNQFENVVVIVTTKSDGLSLWTLCHGPDASQWSHATSLPPPICPPLTRQRILPNPTTGLGGRTLRVVAKQYTNFVMDSDEDDSDPYTGISVEILKELSKRLNFSYTYVPATGDSWGRQLDNGQWDGPIGMLTRQEADLAISGFELTAGRSSVAEPVIITYDHTGIMFRTLGVQQSQWDFYVRPFKVTVYAVVAGCLAGMLLLLMMMEKVEKSVLIGGQPTPETTSQRILRNVEMLIAGLLNKACTIESQSRGGRVLVMTWLFTCVLLTSLYSSQLTSSLAAPSHTLPFNSLSELLNQAQYTWGYNLLGSVDTMLKSSTVPELQLYRQGALRFSKTDPSVFSGNFSLHLAKVARGNYAFLTSGLSVIEQLEAEFCGIEKLPDIKITNAVAFYLQKDSPYSKLISTEIGRMMDSGLVNHWTRKWTPSKRQCDPDDDEQGGRVVGLAHTLSAFCLAATGLGLAALTLGLERWVRHLSDRHRRHQSSSCP